MFKRITLLTLISIFLVACGGREADAPAAPQTVTLMTHDSFDMSEDVIAAFEAAHNARLVLLPAGDAGAALNQAILAAENPLADVFFGVDNSFMGRALAADIFEPYDSPQLANLRPELRLDASNRLLPVDYGDVCLNVDLAWFAARDMTPPQSLADLTDPAYRGLTVALNPATSSPGLAFLLATIAAFGESGAYTYRDFWADLRANDVLITDGWSGAYWGHFSAASDGDRPVVVSYASSPAAEVVFADPPIDAPPTAAVTSAGSCYRQVEFVGILRGTENRELAEKLVDFMLDLPFQNEIPLHMFVFPAHSQASLPEVFVQWAAIPAEPALLDAARVDANREAWIQAWTEVVLR
jgi:thiamine transport system substrate-binding protein